MLCNLITETNPYKFGFIVFINIPKELLTRHIKDLINCGLLPVLKKSPINVRKTYRFFIKKSVIKY